MYLEKFLKALLDLVSDISTLISYAMITIEWKNLPRVAVGVTLNIKLGFEYP